MCSQRLRLLDVGALYAAGCGAVTGGVMDISWAIALCYRGRICAAPDITAMSRP